MQKKISKLTIASRYLWAKLIIALVLTLLSSYIVRVDINQVPDSVVGPNIRLSGNYFLSSGFVKIATVECDGICSQQKGFPLPIQELTEGDGINPIGFILNILIYFFLTFTIISILKIFSRKRKHE